TLSWNADAVADGYYVNFGTDNPPTDVLNMYGNGALTTLDVSGLAGATTYYWEVIPYNANGNAVGFATWSFTTYDSAPSEVAMILPADLATGVSEYPTFTWIADAWADGYNLYISDDNANFVMTDVGAVTGVTLTTPLNYETMYYWYVTAYNPNGESPAPLAIRSFTVQINPDFGGDGTLYGGYYFANSTVDGGGFGYQPTFDWIDISTTGTTFSLSIDGLQTAIPIGFTFNHFGVNYTELTVAANGTVQFTGFDSDWDSAGNLFIPDAATPNDLIALIAMDCDPSQIPTLFYYDNDADGNFVFSAYMWNDYSDIAEFVDVQMILYPSGRIKIQYQNYMNPYGDTGLNSILGDACIGIENADGTIGHQYRNNGDGGPMLDDMALCYAMTAEGLAEPVAGLDAPTNLVLTYDLGLMNLVWDSVPGATMYNVY
ncbi:MAG: hypothetical protein P9L91_00035, partial [Candidatus Zophobacter franzmannii]|nr:hypothetical protein [Candidatus Zophobacter franzmannii]